MPRPSMDVPHAPDPVESTPLRPMVDGLAPVQETSATVVEMATAVKALEGATGPATEAIRRGWTLAICEQGTRAARPRATPRATPLVASWRDLRTTRLDDMTG